MEKFVSVPVLKVRIGFYSELSHGSPEGGSILSAKGRLCGVSPNEAAAYLRGGKIIATAPKISSDYFTGDHIGGLRIMQSGQYIYPSDLIYYVEKYGVGLPEELICAIQKSSKKSNVLERLKKWFGGSSKRR